VLTAVEEVKTEGLWVSGAGLEMMARSAVVTLGFAG